jgi:hypothetical protein
LLKELQLMGEEEILEEIDLLLQELSKFATNQNAFLLLAETRLLLGKLALIRLNFEEAQQFFTRAQNFAEDHHLHRLARQISAEHDKMLRDLDVWQNLKETQATIQDRLKMGSTEDIIKRMLKKQASNPPDIVDETPLLLIIMSSGGTPIFIHPFSDTWGQHDAVFGTFLSAVNSWSQGVFATSIDRIIMGENIILMQVLKPFTVCYVIQGQSYPAQQKLTRFLTEIQIQKQIWDKLQESHQTNLLLTPINTPTLSTVVNEIFNAKVEGEN